MQRSAGLSKQALLSVGLATLFAASVAHAAGEAEPIVPPRLAVRPSVPGNLTPLNELAGGIDNLIESVATVNGVPPAPLCDDLTFLRRVSLDLVGEIPSLDEVTAFAKNTDPRKRQVKVLEMLKRPEYAERWSQFWSDTFLGAQNSGVFTRIQEPVFQHYIWQNLRADRGFDELTRDLLTASSGPTATYLSTHLSQTDLPKTADHVARTFLGARIGCAQCHDHPFDKWTQQDFWGFASFLAFTNGGYNNAITDSDTRITGEKYAPPSPEYELMARFLDGTLVDFTQPLPPAPVAVARQPQPMGRVNGAGPRPRSLEGSTTGEKLRRALAELVIERDDLRYDRAITNRVWSAFFGRGLVHPIDDIRSKQNGPHDDILDLLAADFHASKRDLKRLVTLIVSTQAYQRASVAPASQPSQKLRDHAVRYFVRADVRMMSPEMLANALMRISAGEDRYAGLQRARAQERQYDRKFVSNTQQLHATLLARFSAKTTTGFNQPTPDSPETENSFQRALMMMNADFMQRLAQDGANAMKARTKDDLYAIFGATLGRAPVKEELKKFEELNLKREAILWAIFNSAEFSSIH